MDDATNTTERSKTMAKITFHAAGNTNPTVARAAADHFQEVGFSRNTMVGFLASCRDAGIEVRRRGQQIYLIS